MVIEFFSQPIDLASIL